MAVPVVMAGSLVSTSSIQRILSHPAAPVLTLDQMSEAPQPHPLSSRLPIAVIVQDLKGTQTLELLGSYELLAASGAFQTRTVALKRELAPTTSNFFVLPEMTFSELSGPPPLLVIPSGLDPDNPDLINAVRERAPRARLVVALGEGARLLANAGLLDGKGATSHPLALDSLKRAYPRVHWVGGASVRAGNLITTAGMKAGLEAVLEAATELAGPTARQRALAETGFQPAPRRSASPELRPLSLRENATLLMHSSFDWSKKTLGAVLLPGVSELGLASALEAQPRSLSYRVKAFAPTLGWFRSRHGLGLYPQYDFKEPERPDWVVLAPGIEPGPTRLALQWAQDWESPLMDWRAVPPGQALRSSLDALAREQGATVTRLVARLLLTSEPADWSVGPDAAPDPSLWIKIPLLALAGIGIFRFVEWRRRVRASLN
jgi:transcriptional regulator GlxA family with amidase domain